MNSSLNAVTCSKVLSFFSSVYKKKKKTIHYTFSHPRLLHWGPPREVREK